MMPELIGVDEISQVLNISRDYARDRVVKRPDFPRPVLSLSQKVRRWHKDDFEAWLQKQMKRNAR